MSAARPNVAVLGLGAMGLPMATTLAAAFAVTAFDPDPTDEPGEDVDGAGQVRLEPIELYRTRGR